MPLRVNISLTCAGPGLIDPSRLEAAGKAVQALEQRAERARGGAGAGLGTAAEGAAVILERWDSVAAVLPVLISRMRTLKVCVCFRGPPRSFPSRLPHLSVIGFCAENPDFLNPEP